MTAVPHDLYLSLNSDLGVTKSADGSEFTVVFQPALTIPANSQNVTVALVQGTFWWTIPNFLTCTIQLFFYTLLGEVTTVVNVPKGLYNYKQINVLIANAAQDIGFARDSVVFVENGATSSIDLTFSVPAGLVFPAGSCNKQFGYDADVRYQFISTVDATYRSQFVRAPRTANFDAIQYLTVGTSLVSGGFRLNGGIFKNVIANIVINAVPGYQITNTPSLPLEVPTAVLSDPAGLDRASFFLMDQDGFSVDTNGEAWTLLLRIRYYN